MLFVIGIGHRSAFMQEVFESCRQGIFRRHVPIGSDEEIITAFVLYVWSSVRLFAVNRMNSLITVIVDICVFGASGNGLAKFIFHVFSILGIYGLLSDTLNVISQRYE